MNRHRSIIAYATLAAAVTSAVIAQGGGEGAGYDLSWNTIDGGGGTSSAGAYELSGTIGQPDASGPLTGGGYELVGGFWPGADTPQPQCPGDTNNSGTVDVDDLIAVILGWGACPGCPPAQCPSDIAPFPGGNCATDVDDLIAVILAWGPCG